jgi:RNA polymerase sigma-70 factor (ECF subfamily)
LDDDAFEQLYAAEASALFSFLAYRTGDRSLAEDLLADAFERALRGRYNARKGSAKTWLYAIALNVLRDHLRRAAAESRAYERVEDGVARDPFADVEVRDELMRGLTRLSAEEREAISLRYGAGLTVPEMATVLGEPLTTVEGRVYRALRKLREALA